MKIEFKKLPFTAKEFACEYDSVKLEGSFCKISPSLAKVDSTLAGTTSVECCRCGLEYTINIEENFMFLLSDGVYKNQEEEDLVLEVENHIVDFDEIIYSELSSIKSDYHVCADCLNNNQDIEQEY
jgi:hypothetical protein